MRLLVLDTETTGLSPRFHNILTIGMLPIEVNKEKLEILGSKHIFIKHKQYTADPQALAINKINLEEHHKKAITTQEACEEVQTYIKTKHLQKTPLLGHNLAFDAGFLKNLFEKEKQTLPFHYERQDTMHIWRGLKKEQKIPTELRSNLQTIAEYFKLDYTKAHDAIEDCHITAKAYQKMLPLI